VINGPITGRMMLSLLADQPLACWAEADAPTIPAQLETFPQNRKRGEE
jgi:hypothetical protein